MEKKRIYPENTPPGNIPYNVVNPAFRYRAIVPADDSIVMEVDANGVLYVSAQGLRVEAPVAKIVEGEKFEQLIILSSETEDARIFYTFDGSSPIIGISHEYQSPINISSLENDKQDLIFVAAKNGLVNSLDSEFIFYVPSAPTISIEEGGLVNIINNDSVKSQIYYTVDGSTPTTDAKLYEKPFTVGKGTPVIAVAYYDGIHGDYDTGSY